MLPSGIFLLTILCGLTLPFVCSFALSSCDCATLIMTSDERAGESARLFNGVGRVGLQTGFLRLASVVLLTDLFSFDRPLTHPLPLFPRNSYGSELRA